MSRISARAFRKGLCEDLNIIGTDLEKLPPTKWVSRSVYSVFMLGKGGNKKRDQLTKRKIYNYYAGLSEHPAIFEEFWGVYKEYYDVM